MKFIRLTAFDGEIFYLNMNNIDMFTWDSEDKVTLLWSPATDDDDNEPYRVKETPKTIIELLEGKK